MLQYLKHFLKKSVNSIGFEISRYTPESSSLARLISSFRTFNIDIVFDIGANKGQYAKELRAGGYVDRIVSFEPLSNAYTQLVKESKRFLDWHVHSRCAIGDRIGSAQFNISGNSVSSSILPMLKAHSKAAPDSAYIGREQTPIETIDSVLPQYLNGNSVPFLKIDTQGYEWQVLEGATKILRQICGIQIELSMIELYEGQRLWRELLHRLEKDGFTLWSLHPEFIDPNTGQVLQTNGIFYR